MPPSEAAHPGPTSPGMRAAKGNVAKFRDTFQEPPAIVKSEPKPGLGLVAQAKEALALKGAGAGDVARWKSEADRHQA